MKHTIEFDEKCKACEGTGLFQGMGEMGGRGGAAVVCHDCKGTGCYHYEYEYEDFTEREKKAGVKHVVEVNPGIGVGEGNGYKFSDFGGMSYEDWLAGKPFVAGMEMRKFTCPAGWYQKADYEKKPNWKECIGWGSFSGCDSFCNKEKCWERWDKENK
jgi:hypothetical protein